MLAGPARRAGMRGTTLGTGVEAIRSKSWAVALVVAVAAVGYLMVTALQAGSSYYVTVAEAAELAGRGGAAGRAVRVQGVVAADGLEWERGRLQLRFWLEDEQAPGRRLHVEYAGARPDGMEPGRTVIVEGRLYPGRVQATAILVRCPSRYEVEVARLPRRES